MAIFVFSPRYYSDVGEHVLQTGKYRETYKKLLREGGVAPEDVVEPSPAADEEVLLVHTPRYLEDLRGCRHTARTWTSELPITREIVEAYFLATGGTVLAAEKALQAGRGLNLTGGFHHCFPERAEGFCYLNDLAVAVRALQKRGRIRRAAVIDCDLHQGNGTAFIFRDDPTVFTFSIHQENLYPVKRQSDLDVGLEDFAGDDVYLPLIERHVPRILDEHKPELVICQAGVDPYEGDQLGSLRLTEEGLRRRDRFVVGECARRGIPIAGTLGGGYAFREEDTVRLHFNTCMAFREG